LFTFDRLYPGNGDGTFGSSLNVPLGPALQTTADIAVGDLNNDGKLDFIQANSGVESRVYLGL